MATKEFKLPDVGEGVAEGELVSWLVEAGDTVSEDQAVAEVETDKALVEVPSPYDGTVKELLVDEGEIVPVGTVIITFEVDEGEVDEDSPEIESGEVEAEDTGAEPAEGAETEAKPEEGERAPAEETEPPEGFVFAPPSVRRLARELGVDLDGVRGSGPSGRLTEGDVRAAAEDGDEGAAAEQKEAGTDRESAITRRDTGEGVSGAGTGGDGESVSGAGAAGDGETVSGAETRGAASAEAAGRDRTLAAPATRKLAEDLDVDLNDVPSEEEHDGEAFVSPEAVQAYADAQREAQAVDAAAVSATAGEERPREERVPYRGVRRTIGQQMERSKYTAPHVTHHDTVDVSGLVETRAALKERAEERGVRLTYMPFVMKAIVAALREFPMLNATLDEENGEIVHKHYYNVGIAVATDAGLMVPVVKDVQEKSVLELADEVDDLATRARERKVSREEMQGGTFTITNFGAIGGEYATPIINYPETAILGLGGIEKRPVVEGDDVVARETLPLSLSIDHRVVDGAEAARFTNRVMEYLSEPKLLLLE